MKEVTATSESLKDIGYKGVILAYGKEIVLDKGEKVAPLSQPSSSEAILKANDDVRSWKDGTVQTVKMAQRGDFVALKFSGAGRDIMQRLAAGLPPNRMIDEATTEICEKAKERGVGVLFDAEQAAVQQGIDAWTLEFQKRFNKERAVVFGTYQAYLRVTPSVLVNHLAFAKEKHFTLGVKLVRGAYMASDRRDLFWNSKAETDAAYDGITAALSSRTWNEILEAPEDQAMPKVSLMVASHNMESVQKSMACSRQQMAAGRSNIELSYGQLMGMADEVSCELVMANKQQLEASKSADAAGISAYKYCVWGPVSDCVKYLVRRAEENRDAMSRATGTRMALAAELRRRVFG